MAAGERLLVTRDGVAVAELGPTSAARVDASTLLERWRHVPRIDADDFGRDVAAVLDAAL